ncbi:MAG: aldo/keto reductase [Anaerolineales bacterium]|nr:aldo/keto reductase [Anaerolineales bacterium]MCW5854407.1 aldo/keto reductase [Anaerolineales bacterium]
MEYRAFGNRGLRVSEIGHGLWGMGDWKDSDDAQSLEALELSLSLGCNFYDTAWIYGSGHSEQLLGQLLRNHPDEKIVVATKVPPKNRKWPANPQDALEDTFPSDHIIEYTKRSLENLGIDCIDIQQLHVWDDHWAAHPSWQEAAQRLKEEGLIRQFGLSLNRWEPWNGLQAIRSGAVDSIQVIYNIFDQAPEDELFPLCQQMGVGVIARVPLDEGGLSGKLTQDTRFAADDWRNGYFGPENLAETVSRAEALKALLPAGMSLAELAMRFSISHPAVSTSIPGMRKPQHVRQNIAVSDGQALPDELLEALRHHRWDRKVAPWSD